MIVAAATSTDTAYNGLLAGDLIVSNIDTDTSNIVVVDTTSDVLDGDTSSIAALNANRGADGFISLREAITATNNTANGATADEIHFNIGLNDAGHLYYQDDATADSLSSIVTTTLADGAITDFDADYLPGTARSWYRIQTTANLPALDDTVIIDATTQTGYLAGAPVIELSGTIGGNVGLGISGGDGSEIRGLVINDYSWLGINVSGGINHVIAGNFIGTDVSGTLAKANDFDGIYVNANGTTIGGTTLADRNVVSGNLDNGINIENADNVTVQGNYIGTDASGSEAIGNSTRGVYVQAGSDNAVIGGTAVGSGNVVSGNNGDGIEISSGGGNVVQGNLIGLDATGTVDLGNAGYGIQLIGGTGQTIGGISAGASNVVSGNNSVGVLIESGSNGNIVQGNYIGTDITGTSAIGNSLGGITVYSANNIIGGTAAGRGNVISGNNQEGLTLWGVTATANTVQGNLIGVDASGINPLGNNARGVRLGTGASNNLIGGTAAGAGNVIANTTSGDGIDHETGSGNSFLGNVIYGNAGLGIDLSYDGVTSLDGPRPTTSAIPTPDQMTARISPS